MKRLLYVFMLIASVALYASCDCGCNTYKGIWDIRVTYLDGKVEDKVITIDGVYEDSQLKLSADEKHPTPCIVVTHPSSFVPDQDIVCGVREFSVVKERKEEMTPAEQEKPRQKSRKSPLV